MRSRARDNPLWLDTVGTSQNAANLFLDFVPDRVSPGDGVPAVRGGTVFFLFGFLGRCTTMGSVGCPGRPFRRRLRGLAAPSPALARPCLWRWNGRVLVAFASA